MAFIWVRDIGNGVNHLGFQRGCKPVILVAFIHRLWLNTVICSRFSVYCGITGDVLVIKNSVFTKAVQFYFKYETGKKIFMQNLAILKLFGGLVCLFVLWVCGCFVHSGSKQECLSQHPKTPLTLGKLPCV